jgi:hypothetical protein
VRAVYHDALHSLERTEPAHATSLACGKERSQVPEPKDRPELRRLSNEALEKIHQIMVADQSADMIG